MREQVVLTGMVIKSAPAGEYDRRLVILTCERGKITAFARGARRPGSTLMASSAPFVFGTFSLYEGRDAYSLVSVEVQNYFREITENMEAACYGSYFLEFAVKAHGDQRRVHGKASGKAGRLHDLYVGIRSRVSGGKALHLYSHGESPGRIYKVRGGK